MSPGAASSIESRACRIKRRRVPRYSLWQGMFDLSGYTLTDDLAMPGKYLIPNGTIVPPNGFLLVWADDLAGSQEASGDLHVNFQLNPAGEAIGLFAPGAATVDSLTFGAQSANVSQGRSPDGQAPPFQSMLTSTMGWGKWSVSVATTSQLDHGLLAKCRRAHHGSKCHQRCLWCQPLLSRPEPAELSLKTAVQTAEYAKYAKEKQLSGQGHSPR